MSVSVRQALERVLHIYYYSLLQVKCIRCMHLWLWLLSLTSDHHHHHQWRCPSIRRVPRTRVSLLAARSLATIWWCAWRCARGSRVTTVPAVRGVVVGCQSQLASRSPSRDSANDVWRVRVLFCSPAHKCGKCWLGNAMRGRDRLGIHGCVTTADIGIGRSEEGGRSG